MSVLYLQILHFFHFVILSVFFFTYTKGKEPLLLIYNSLLRFYAFLPDAFRAGAFWAGVSDLPET